MIAYLALTSLLIPVNIWASITPHLHTALTMRLLHGVSTLALLPLLLSLWKDRRLIQPVPGLVLAIFLGVMVVVNANIALQGMGIYLGWVDHLLLALGALSVEAYYLLEEHASPPLEYTKRNK